MDAQTVITRAIEKGCTLTTAESCTGGMVGAALTDIPGASAAYTHGFITYSNGAKTQLLGVPAALITQFGAVSAEVAGAMAKGALDVSGADIAIAVTGIAGPDGGSAAKPVGTVWFGLAVKGKAATPTHLVFEGTRAQIRAQACVHALQLLANAVDEV